MTTETTETIVRLKELLARHENTTDYDFYDDVNELIEELGTGDARVSLPAHDILDSY